MKTKRFAALALAALMLAAVLSGCTFKTPASVGSVGGVDIPAGVYLLLQSKAYGRAAGQTTDADVLKAVITVDEEELTGLAFVQRETLRAVEEYAAVETLFAELGGSLTEEEQAYADSYAESIWASSQEELAANGIGLVSLKLWMQNSAKAGKLLELAYGPDGSQPVSDAELTSFVEDSFVRGSYLALPLLDYTTDSMADEETDQKVTGIAEKIRTGRLAGEEWADLAAEHLPDAYALVGQTFDPAGAATAVGSLLAPASQLAQYGEETQSALLGAKPGDVVIVDTGLSRMVCQLEEVLGDDVTLEDLRATALSEMKQEELDETVSGLGASLEHALDQSAMDRYSPKNIKD